MWIVFDLVLQISHFVIHITFPIIIILVRTITNTVLDKLLVQDLCLLNISRSQRAIGHGEIWDTSFGRVSNRIEVLEQLFCFGDLSASDFFQ